MPAVVTIYTARAAGWDAGNRSAIANGRTHWSIDDWVAACEVTERLLGGIEAGVPKLLARVADGKAAP